MKSKSSQKNMQKREIAYNNNFNINQRKKDYDALNDKYASYYFAHRSVKRHLKELKRAVDEQRNIIERNKLKTMISSKIKFKFPEMLKERIDLYIDIAGPNEGSRVKDVSSQKKKLINTFIGRRSSRYSLHKKFSNRDTVKFPSLTHTNNSQELDQKNKMNQESLVNEEKILQSELLHKKNHRTFLNFLQRKKQMITNRKSSTNGNEISIKIDTSTKDFKQNAMYKKQQPNEKNLEVNQLKNHREQQKNHTEQQNQDKKKEQEQKMQSQQKQIKQSDQK